MKKRDTHADDPMLLEFTYHIRHTLPMFSALALRTFEPRLHCMLHLNRAFQAHDALLESLATRTAYAAVASCLSFFVLLSSILLSFLPFCPDMEAMHVLCETLPLASYALVEDAVVRLTARPASRTPTTLADSKSHDSQ